MENLRHVAEAREDSSRAFLPHPSRLFVEVTSRCNLHCRMCVKHSGNAREPEGDMSPAIFESLAPAFPHLDALILNGVGEPLMHNGLEAFIRLAKKRMPPAGWIGFQTNGHLMTRERALSLVEAGLDRVCLSIDAVTPALFTDCRAGGDLRHVEQALSALREARKHHSGSRLEIGVEFVLMRKNLSELPVTLRWAASRGADYAVVSHIMPYAEEMTAETVFGANTEASRAFYLAWLARAEREGVDLRGYFEFAMRYNKSTEEKRVVDFIRSMTDAARAADIPFHLENLLLNADAVVADAQAVFEDARAVARETGLRLALPALLPQHIRRCPSVEDGGAFVTWDGRVAPCYFLWRSYSCHVYGWKKLVRPRFFGFLTESDINTVWNSQEYAAFRQDVVRHAYPFCTNCNVYPCEDIETTDLECDCYTETVPCGDCLWCLGLLQCMGQEQEDQLGNGTDDKA